MNPVITFATCFLLLITWASPPAVYAGEAPGMVWIDGEVRMLHLESAGPPARWSGALYPGDQVVESGYVVVQEYPTTAWIENTPVGISCRQVWLPLELAP